MSSEITTYSDYRDFLQFKYKAAKEKKASFSLQHCANHLKVSKTFVKLVFDKKRNFTFPTLPLVWTLFKLTPTEQMQLTFLFCYTNAENEILRSHFRAVLSELETGKITPPLYATETEVND
ncbi:hypothetical protein DOM22_01105 [Bdellovibrio sp. ZAP7]|uniref:hypothetical protein n=1 Tax=Bdellovibrio sp. ZAP7 TaxID=2231053 RepID=UPI0011592477|nr:hypothetical protein [Bdellovibrio sp. ZAP7]QDK43857.1 hypothetical protein DOM22_01105 [Bdellovibrio sp. ZAP7]